MAIETVYPHLDIIYTDLLEILGTATLELKSHVRAIANESIANLFEAAEENAKADGIRMAIDIIRDLRTEAMRTKLEIEERDECLYIARILKNEDYLREYGSPVIFRGATEDEVRLLAKVYCESKDYQLCED